MNEREKHGGIVDRVCQFIRAENLFLPDDDLVVGFSGGPDSVALALILQQLATHGFWHGEALLTHLNHGLRGDESDADERFCNDFARRHNMEFVAERLSPGHVKSRPGSEEEAARDIRYDFLQRIARSRNIGTVVTAHHADDVAETVLMRLIRGCGLSGLGAVPAARPITPNSEARLVRPLLKERRSDLLEVLHKEGEKYRYDSSNRDTAYFRNRIRHELVPCLRENGSKTVELLGHINDIAQEINYMLEAQVASEWRNLHIEWDCDGIAIDSCGFQRLSRPFRRLVAHKALENLEESTGGAIPLKREHWEAVCGLVERPVGTALSLPGRCAVQHEHKTIYFFREDKLKIASEDIEKHLYVPGKVILKPAGMRLKGAFMPLEEVDISSLTSGSTPYHVYLSGEGLQQPFTVRTRRDGDVFFPLGSPGKKKLKDYFIDKKVPRHVRDRIPLVLDGGGEIMWVVGHEISESFRLAGGEDIILELTCERYETRKKKT